MHWGGRTSPVVMRAALPLWYKASVGKCREVVCSVGCEVQFVKHRTKGSHDWKCPRSSPAPPWRGLLLALGAGWGLGRVWFSRRDPHGAPDLCKGDTSAWNLEEAAPSFPVPCRPLPALPFPAAAPMPNGRFCGSHKSCRSVGLLCG